MRKLLCIVALLWPLVAQAGFGFNTQPIPGLVGWWTFNDGGGSTAADYSGFSHVGSLSNSPPWTNGLVGGALDFNGTNQLVKLGDATAFQLQALTVAAWVKCRALSSPNNYPGILTHNGGSWGLVAQRVENNFGFARSWVASIASSSASIGSGWQHVVTTCSNAGTNKTAQMYIDGVASGSPGTYAGDFTFPQPVFVGMEWSTTATAPAYFKGQIDDVRIYNRVLTAEEVKMIYNGGSGSQR